MQNNWSIYWQKFNYLQQGGYVFGSVGLSVYWQYYSKTYEWMSMKFSGKIEDGTINKPLNFGSNPAHSWSTILDPITYKAE